MSADFNLIPDERLIFQGAAFLLSAFITHRFLLKPLSALSIERRKRTLGREEEAKRLSEKSLQIKKDIDTEFNRLKENLRKEKEALKKAHLELLSQSLSQIEANHLQNLKQSQDELQKSLSLDKDHYKSIQKSLWEKLSQQLLPVIIFGLWAPYAFSSSDEAIFWPYYQFAWFLVFIYFLGKKPLKNMLMKNRDELKTHLSESLESLNEAQKEASSLDTKMASLSEDLENYKEKFWQDWEKEKTLIQINFEESINYLQGTYYLRFDNYRKELLFSIEKKILTDLMNSSFITDNISKIDQKLKKKTLDTLSEKNSIGDYVS